MRFTLDWLAPPTDSSASHELLTRCRLGLTVDAQPVFRHEDLLGEHQVKDAIVVSSYPLALWFAANWWRLRWEPAANNPSTAVIHDWKMSHVLAAAGGGYAWPNLSFASDGENVLLTLEPSQNASGPLRYLERLATWVATTGFEAAVDHLISATLQQLQHAAQQDPLHELWQTVLEERANPALALKRQLEARLGYDPEEAPQSLIAELAELVTAHGADAIQELASLGSESVMDNIQAARQGLSGSRDQITLPISTLQPWAGLANTAEPKLPWEKGRYAAIMARRQLNVDKGPVSNRALADLLQTPAALFEHAPSAKRMPISIGELTDSGRVKVVLGKARPESRRFMTARLLADGISHNTADNWLPCTDAGTARQKFQRAFAQEFLCPYDDLIEWMGTTTPDTELMGAAAEHFAVSPLLINTVMVNHGHLPRSELAA